MQPSSSSCKNRLCRTSNPNSHQPNRAALRLAEYTIRVECDGSMSDLNQAKQLIDKLREIAAQKRSELEPWERQRLLDKADELAAALNVLGKPAPTPTPIPLPMSRPPTQGTETTLGIRASSAIVREGDTVEWAGELTETYMMAPVVCARIHLQYLATDGSMRDLPQFIGTPEKSLYAITDRNGTYNIVFTWITPSDMAIGPDRTIQVRARFAGSEPYLGGNWSQSMSAPMTLNLAAAIKRKISRRKFLGLPG